ncbi:MAG TPA: HEAT repeat domain-containing protein [Blastocatellia bacterium]|nr:HEAT repeat domain-containing protein [Blastocatellia bacterium]
MNIDQPLIDGEIPAGERRSPSRKYPWAIVVVIVLFVIIPFISWYGTWFGRPLSDAKMEEYLNDRDKPRNVQHALAQIGNRIIDGDEAVKRFYPAVISASQHEQAEVRMTAAWAMGQDNAYQDFHPALLSLLQDPIAGVRHNAALALVRFGDTSGRPEIVAMLEPATLRAESSGTVELIIKEEGAPVAAGAPLARITHPDGSKVEVRAAEAGRIDSISAADGKSVEIGDELMTLSPSPDQVWEALRALYLVGRPDDIPHVQRYTRPSATMPDRVRQQAASTVDAIRGGTGKTP